MPSGSKHQDSWKWLQGILRVDETGTLNLYVPYLETLQRKTCIESNAALRQHRMRERTLEIKHCPGRSLTSLLDLDGRQAIVRESVAASRTIIDFSHIVILPG